MVKESALIVKPGQKFRHKRKGTVYIVKNVQGDTVVLVSENGEAVMRIHQGSLATSGFEPVYD